MRFTGRIATDMKTPMLLARLAAIGVAISFLLGSAVPAAEPKPAVKSPADQAREKQDAAKTRKAVYLYLYRKVGTVKTAPLPKGDGMTECLKQYEAAAKTKDPLALYRLMYAHLLRAQLLLQAKDVEQRREGLGMVLGVVSCAAERLKDKWLLPKLADGYLLPNLDAARDSGNDFPTTDTVLTGAQYAYTKGGDRRGLIAAYRLMLDHALGRGDANTADAARLKLGVFLEQEGKFEEAAKLLEAIDPKGSLAGGMEMVLPRVRKAVAAKDAKKPKLPK